MSRVIRPTGCGTEYWVCDLLDSKTVEVQTVTTEL
jgi:hypothetical protein